MLTGHEQGRVLLLESYTRQVLPMAKAFKQLDCEVDTLNDTRFDLGYVTRFSDHKFVVRNVSSDEKTLTDALDRLLLQKQYDVIVPLSDFSADVLSRNYDRYAQLAPLAVNRREVFSRAYDKLNTMKRCAQNNIPSPVTVFDPACINDIAKLGYPVIVKPRSECGSIGLHVFYKESTLAEFLRNNPQAYTTNLFQEYIQQSGKQYNAQAFVDVEGHVKSLIVTEKVRWFPLDGGASTMCMEVDCPAVFETCKRLLQALDWRGYCDIDLIEDPRDGIAKVIEVNARISANVKLCFASGIDVARQILEFSRGTTVSDYTNYRHQRRLRCLHTDLLWFIKSPERFSRRPSWFSLRRTTDQIFDWSDPIPFFVFSLRAIKQYRGAMEKRKR